MQRHINQAGLAILKAAETLALTAYLCPAHKLTIGWGHTGADVYLGMTITRPQAEDLLEKDVASAEWGVTKLVHLPITDNQFSALVDFVFNLGAGKLAGSTLLKMLNHGDFIGAAAEFLKWDKAHVDGKVVTLEGLAKRRAAERALFLKEMQHVLNV